MQQVNVLGVSNPMQFPADMGKDNIRDFLRKKFAKQAVEGTQPADLGEVNLRTMQAYDPSLSEKIATGIGEGLHSSGIISDRHGAQQIGKNVGGILEFAPGVGDAVDVSDFGRAAATGDALGMGMAALGAIPVIGGIAKKGVNKIGDTLKSKFPDMGIGLRETSDNIILDKVIVPDSQRGQGKGSGFMRELLTEADNSGKPIGLTPSSDFGGNKKRLTDFYKGFGFIENKGKNKDFTISESMIRLPEPPKPPSTALNVPGSPLSGLPMGDTASKTGKGMYKMTSGESLSDLGDIDFDNPITHATPDNDFDGVIQRRKHHQPFDGLFSSYGESSNYGGNKEITYYPRKGGIARHGDADFDYDKSIALLKKKYPDADEDKLNDLYEITAEESSVWDRASNPLEDYGYDDLGEASWEAQNIRGEMAVDQGFDAVEMDDEFGTSIMIPLGSKAAFKEI